MRETRRVSKRSGSCIHSVIKIAVFTVAALVVSCIWFSADVTETSDQVFMPVLTDVTDENRVYIETVYQNDYMKPSGGGAFGVNDDVNASEAAYVAVAMYENGSGIERSYSDYYLMQDEYINKAVEYGIWPDIGTEAGMPITREEAGAIFAGLVADGAGAGYTELKSLEGYAYGEEALKLYNLGITVDKNAGDAFSPDQVITRGELAKLVTMILKPETRMGITMPDYEQLKNDLTGMMSGYDGDWSLFFEDYETGSSFSVNSHQVFSASIIKLFVIQTVYQRIHDGLMSDSAELEELLARMITYSDNDAWYAVTRRISGSTHSAGMAIVTEIAADYGFADTGTFYLGYQGNYNYTSVNDCGAYLDMLLDGEIVTPEYSEKILDLMKQQQILYKIPAGVPDEVQTANKTGELEYVQGDAAIIFAPFGTYILVVIADDLVNTGNAQTQIRDISEYVYNYLNR